MGITQLAADYPSEIRFARHGHELHGAGADFRRLGNERRKDI